MTVQSTVATNLTAMQVGVPLTGQAILSRIHTASSLIRFGRVVTQGATDPQVNMAVAAGTPVGVAMAANTGSAGSDATYGVGDAVPLMQFGVLPMEVVGAVTKGALLYAITTVGADQGKLSTTVNLAPIGRAGQSLTSTGVIEVMVAIGLL